MSLGWTVYVAHCRESRIDFSQCPCSGVKTSSWSEAARDRYTSYLSVRTDNSGVSCPYRITATCDRAADLLARLKFQPEVCVTWPRSRDAAQSGCSWQEVTVIWCCDDDVLTHDTAQCTVSGPHDSLTYNIKFTLYGTVGNMHTGVAACWIISFVIHWGMGQGGGGPPRVTPSRGWHPKEKNCGQIYKE